MRSSIATEPILTRVNDLPCLLLWRERRGDHHGFDRQDSRHETARREVDQRDLQADQRKPGSELLLTPVLRSDCYSRAQAPQVFSREYPRPAWYKFKMKQPEEIGGPHASSRAMVLASALVLTLLPALLLRTVVAALAKGSEGVAFVNPSFAIAGLGFVGLWLVLVWWGAWSLVSGEPLTGGPMNVRRLAGASTAALVALSFVAAEPLTNVYAKWHGYRRCAAADRFQAGNTPKNDVTLHAYVRLDTTNALLRARCDGATDPTSSR